MNTKLVTTVYFYQGKVESFTRAYLPSEGEGSAQEQAAEFFAARDFRRDSNSEMSFVEREITDETLIECYPSREDLILAAGRIYALDAIDNGSPAIPVGTIYKDWLRDLDVHTGALSEWLGEYTAHELALFLDSYATNLFNESESGDPIEHDEDCDCAPCKEAADKGAQDGIEEAETVYTEQGIEVIRDTLRPGVLGWDEGAMNAGAAAHRGIEQSHEASYYAAFDLAARQRAIEIDAEERRLEGEDAQ